jgi:hypothetical protein
MWSTIVVYSEYDTHRLRVIVIYFISKPININYLYYFDYSKTIIVVYATTNLYICKTRYILVIGYNLYYACFNIIYYIYLCKFLYSLSVTVSQMCLQFHTERSWINRITEVFETRRGKKRVIVDRFKFIEFRVNK